jgi:hypothetical protein
MAGEEGKVWTGIRTPNTFTSDYILGLIPVQLLDLNCSQHTRLPQWRERIGLVQEDTLTVLTCLSNADMLVRFVSWTKAKRQVFAAAA